MDIPNFIGSLICIFFSKKTVHELSEEENPGIKFLGVLVSIIMLVTASILNTVSKEKVHLSVDEILIFPEDSTHSAQVHFVGDINTADVAIVDSISNFYLIYLTVNGKQFYPDRHIQDADSNGFNLEFALDSITYACLNSPILIDEIEFVLMPDAKDYTERLSLELTDDFAIKKLDIN